MPALAAKKKACKLAWVRQKVPEEWSQLERLGQRTDRTWNIPLMSVTLDVSKLSSWLKAAAPCHVRRRGQMQAGKPCGLEIGKRRAHVKHVSHACDISCIKIQRLVEH